MSVDGFIRVGAQYAILTYLTLFLVGSVGLPLVAASSYLARAHTTGAIGRIGWVVVSDRVVRGRRRPAYMLVALLAAAALVAFPAFPQRRHGGSSQSSSA